MLNLLRKLFKSNFNIFKKVSPYDGLELFFYYKFFLHYFTDYHEGTIADILSGAKDELKFPIDYKYLEACFPGYKFKYIGLPKNESIFNGVDGLHRINGDTYYVFYNQELSQEYIRYTKVHELIHFYQLKDRHFIKAMNGLVELCGLHDFVVSDLLEKATDFAAAIYLMPAEQFYKKLIETKNIYEVSNYFKVPMEAVMCRLKVADQIK